METFGCSFFVHSGWVSGSNNDAVGVAGTADFCVKTGGRRSRSRKRPVIDEGVESCEDGVMVMTSPLTAKVGLWDTAREEKRQLQFLHLASKEKKLSLSLGVTSKSFLLSYFQILRASCSESSIEEQKEDEKVMQRYKIFGKKHITVG